MNKLAVVFSMLAATSVAQAQPSLTAPSKVTATQYVETDLVVGGTAPVAGPSIVLAAQGGYRLSQALWLHGEVSYGDARDDQGRGPAEQLHAGLEGRTCIVHGVLCGIAGADLGYQHGSWTSDRRATDTETVDALVVVPRVGVDVGVGDGPPGVGVGVFGSGVPAAVDVAVAIGVVAPPPQLPLMLNTMCMFGNPMAAVSVGVVMPHAAALR
jgi:hypothetical protein